MAQVELATPDDGTTSKSERIKAIQEQTWIDYEAGETILSRLQWMFEHPLTFRPPCALIVGESNSGKTRLAREFQRFHRPPESETDETEETYPVVFVETPPGPYVAEFYGGLLRAVNAASQPTWSRQRKETQVLDLFPRIGVRMIIIDEIHNILPGSRDQRTIFLNSLKFLTNSLRIPIVAIGTKSAVTAFQTDQQFGNRFEPLQVPNWEPNEEYARFIFRYVRAAGFEMAKAFTAKRVTDDIHAKTKGLTGETVKLLRGAMYASARKGIEKLHPSIFDKLGFVSVRQRRNKASSQADTL